MPKFKTLPERRKKSFLITTIKLIFPGIKCDKNNSQLVTLESFVHVLETTIQDFTKRIVPESSLIKALFQALENGALTEASALSTLRNHGVTLRAEFNNLLPLSPNDSEGIAHYQLPVLNSDPESMTVDSTVNPDPVYNAIEVDDGPPSQYEPPQSASFTKLYSNSTRSYL